MSDFEAIKVYLIQILKDIVNTDVFFSEIKKADDCWWYVDIKPIQLQNLGTFHEVVYMVSISHYKEKADCMYYTTVYQQLCLKLFRGIVFNQRCITINDVSYNVVDNISHSTFNITYQPDPQVETGEMIDKLELNLK